jgi:TolA-binding protein
MSRHRIVQIALICGALLLLIGLIFAPRLPKEKRIAETNPISFEINQAVDMVQNGENPMEGIMKLRAILEEDSTQVDVHWHLAQFSITSRQISNAEERFEKVIQYDTDVKYPTAYFWLAQTKVQLGKEAEAIPLLEEYLNYEQDTVVIGGVERMLNQLKEENNFK